MAYNIYIYIYIYIYICIYIYIYVLEKGRVPFSNSEIRICFLWDISQDTEDYLIPTYSLLLEVGHNRDN